MDNRLRAKLPDGGWVEVTNDEKVTLGTVRAYKELTYTHDGDDDRPACRIVFGVERGVPVCTEFTLTAAGRIPVRAKDVRAIKLDEIRSLVYGYAGIFVKSQGKWVLSVGQNVEEGREHVERASRRHKVTPELLAKVAKIHDNAPASDRADAVAVAFGTSTRNAWRWIARAREERLIS